MAFNGRAWLWATCPDDKYRDGKKAVESATRACELGEWNESDSIATLAAAYAELGDYPRAIDWQETAIRLCSDPGEQAEAEERLKFYQEGKPYRYVPE